MKQVLIKQGGIVVENVPPPQIEPKRLLVRVDHSCVSVGTEMSGVRTSSLPLWKRALQNPGDVRKILDRIKTTGLSETRELVQRKLQTLHLIGYSASGTVIGIGENVEGFSIGDRVACSGSQWASHAQYISVPTNLATLIPDGVHSKAASTVTLGAIALQGVRRANPTLGETFLVIGLGIIGQLTQRILQANGVRVIGLDIKAERISVARTAGMVHALDANDPDLVATAYHLTDGYGVDGVIITAASESDDILSTAFRCCRKKGRVVLVGDIGLDIRRDDIYAKELDFLVSTSYGPGRYDRNYEEDGVDYPVGYVRWTENRNMRAYLTLIADRRIYVEDLVSNVCRLDQVPALYAALSDRNNAPLAALLDYEADSKNDPSQSLRSYPNPLASGSRQGSVRLGLIGAGGFAVSTLLPILARHKDRFSLTTIVTRQGVSATNVARQFNARHASTDVDVLLADPDTDAVMICTRHDSHAPLVLRALKAGKHVFVEKPLCLTDAELRDIGSFYKDRSTEHSPLLMTGFNRRFSPIAQDLIRKLSGQGAPMMINYRINAGFIPPDNWVHGAEGGGRNLGEACHFYDFVTALTRSEIRSVAAQALRPTTSYYHRNDNFAAQLSFSDGSIASILYTASGNKSVSKERIEVFCAGQVYEIDEFMTYRKSGQKDALSSSIPKKGHEEELLAFANAISAGGDWPIPLWQQAQAMRIAFDVEDSIRKS